MRTSLQQYGAPFFKNIQPISVGACYGRASNSSGFDVHSKVTSAYMERTFFVSIKSNKIAVIKLKSLILAQIERWRNALHMQVERQHGSLLLVASGERVSNT